jgi:flagellar biosynthetic protein FliO
MEQSAIANRQLEKQHCKDGRSMRTWGLIVLSAMLLLVTFAGAQTKQDIGSFDIAKVRQAVVDQQTGAADTAHAQHPRAVKGESWAAILLRIAGYLALVVMLILGLFWVLRKTGVVGLASSAARASPASMDVLESLTLGQGRTVVLVRIHDSVLVLAQTTQNVTLLDKLEGPKAIEVIAATRGTSVGQFKDMFSTFLGKMKKPA